MSHPQDDPPPERDRETPPPPQPGVPTGAAAAPPPETPAPTRAGGPQGDDARHTTNGFAVTSLVAGILTPCALVPGIASVVLGILALRQIRRRPQRGRGLAIAGLVITGVWVLVLTVTVAGVGALLIVRDSEGARGAAGDEPAGVAESPTPGTTAPVPSPAPEPTGEAVTAFDLEVGHCLVDLWSEDPSLLFPLVACDEPHDGEVYSLFDLPDGEWPGLDTVEEDALDRCWEVLERDLPEAFDDQRLDVWPLTPTRFTWRDGDREVVCIAIYLDDQRVGSLLDGGVYPHPAGDTPDT